MTKRRRLVGIAYRWDGSKPVELGRFDIDEQYVERDESGRALWLCLLDGAIKVDVEKANLDLAHPKFLDLEEECA